MDTETIGNPQPTPSSDLNPPKSSIDNPSDENWLKSRSFKYAYITVLLLSALVISGIVSALVYREYFAPPPTAIPTIEIDLQADAEKNISTTPLPTTSDANANIQQTYFNLGIQFQYAPEFPLGNTAVIRQQDSRIYVGDAAGQPQFVEVFTKDPNLSVSDAIKNTILAGFDSDKCRLTPPSPPDEASPYSYNQGLRILTIESAYGAEDLGSYISQTEENCPKEYTPTNWIGYFLYHIDFPQNYVFVSVGQDVGWPSSTDPNSTLAWYHTLTFTQ